MRKSLLWLVAMPLIAMSSLSYAEENEFIVHDTENWTITVYSQDKSYWITIQDKNLWASVAWTWEDSYGCYFQWWNNHCFSGIDTISTWSWPVDVSSYWPSEYNSSIFIGVDVRSDEKIYSWDNVRNLWWWWNDSEWNGRWLVDIENTAKNRQWPCLSWYHVPSQWEWARLLDIWRSARDDEYNIFAQSEDDWQDPWSPWVPAFYWSSEVDKNELAKLFSSDLMIPLYWLEIFIRQTLRLADVSARHFWSSTPNVSPWYNGLERLSHVLYLGSEWLNANYTHHIAVALPVRCFKNSYAPLPKTLNLFFMPSTGDVQEVWTWEVTENMTGAVPEKAKNVMKTGYVLEYRYLSGADASTGFDFENTPISWAWADENNNVYFIAQWTGIKYSVEFTWTDVKWTMENQEFTYGITWTLTPNAFTKNWYTFSWWTDSEWNKYTDGQEVNNLTTTSGKLITLTAEWTKNKTSGGSSWWGWMRKDNCPNGDLSPSYYDGTCEGANVSSWTDVRDLEWDTQDSSDKSSEWQTELEQAYQFAFKNSITTMNTIDKANMDWYIKRGHLAKMVVNYVTNVLWKEIPSDIPASCLSFNDEATVRESEEIKDYATKSCALWLMWINMKNNEFLPNDYVPRSQFGAVLSRILRWDKYNLVHTQEKPRYTDHLNALKEEWIMTKIDNPKMLEKRWYVMIMLMRSVK